MTTGDKRAARSTKPEHYLLSMPFLLAVLGIVTGSNFPGTWPAHKILMSGGMVLLVVAYRRTPYLLSAALLADFFLLEEFHLIGKAIGLVGLSLFVSVTLFTWLKQKRRTREP